jgi:hypothetical protein
MSIHIACRWRNIAIAQLAGTGQDHESNGLLSPTGTPQYNLLMRALYWFAAAALWLGLVIALTLGRFGLVKAGNRWLRIPLVVAAAFAFTLLMIAGAVSKAGLPRAVTVVCACLAWPGVTITVDGLQVRVLGGSYFFPLVVAFDTLIYSVIFGLLLWLVQHYRNTDCSAGT